MNNSINVLCPLIRSSIVHQQIHCVSHLTIYLLNTIAPRNKRTNFPHFRPLATSGIRVPSANNSPYVRLFGLHFC